MFRTEPSQTQTATDGQPQTTDCRRKNTRRLGHTARRGATAIEYCLLVSVISIAAVAAIQQIGLKTQSVFDDMVWTLGGGGGGEADTGSSDTGSGDTGGGDTGGGDTGSGDTGSGGTGGGDTGSGGSGGGKGKGGGHGGGHGGGKGK